MILLFKALPIVIDGLNNDPFRKHQMGNNIPYPELPRTTKIIMPIDENHPFCGNSYGNLKFDITNNGPEAFPCTLPPKLTSP